MIRKLETVCTVQLKLAVYRYLPEATRYWLVYKKINNRYSNSETTLIT